MASDLFLVCGLGSLGQHCVMALQEFGAKVIAIEQQPPPVENWEIAGLPDLLEELIKGDCRNKTVLQQARIDQCRAALIVTNSEKVNAETALAIRRLNPHTRLVVRSAKENLNQLLTQQLGNFIAYEATHLPAYPFALSALGTETLGFFNLDGRRLRLLQRKLTYTDPWCHARRLHELNTRTRRIMAHAHEETQLASSFYQWEPDTEVLPGDEIAYIETGEHFILGSYSSSTQDQPKRKRFLSSIPHLHKIVRQNLSKFWQLSFQQQVRRVALFCSVIVIILLLVGTILFKYYYAGTTFVAAFYVTAILLLGGYADLFGSFEPLPELPEWLQLFALGLTITGTAFVGVLYALLTEALLSSKFQFVKKRPPIPSENHVVIIGLGRVGQRVAHLLQSFKQSVVGVSFDSKLDASILPSMPLIVGKAREALSKANLATAKSIVVVTDDEILNLEVAYGYGVMPIYYASARVNPTLMPSDDFRLALGDRLIVLATIEGLQRIEAGSLAPKKWQLEVKAVISESAAFEGANAIARISGCSLAIARKLMNNLPNTLSVKLYRHQGIRLVRTLKRIQVDSSLHHLSQG